MTKNIEERFWSKVKKLEGKDACWEWQIAKDKNGYGKFFINGVTERAHRVIWKLIYGLIPNKSWVLHKCDNPSCVRPDHLFLGNAKINAQDAFQKGRRHPPTQRLNIEDIKAIRKDNRLQREIAKDFGISQVTGSHIQIGRMWKSI